MLIPELFSLTTLQRNVLDQLFLQTRNPDYSIQRSLPLHLLPQQLMEWFSGVTEADPQIGVSTLS